MSSMLGRIGTWLAVALVMVALPLVLNSGTALSLMNLTGIMIIVALSYNVLYGQTGLLSFGQAIYYGLGGYISIHLMNIVIMHRLGVPAAVFPIVGGVSGLAFAALTGWFCTRRSGTSFAMITLGIGEMVVALSLIATTFFGEEDGISTNRMRLAPLLGMRFGSQMEVYYLIAAWCFACMLAMYLLRHTPFGLASSAVRYNSDRAEFIGYNARLVRYIAFCIAGFFAGIAGALSVINFEIVNATALAGAQSGSMLLMAYIGGTGQFAGPILGAVLITFLRIMLSDYTNAWLMYYGILFILVVLYMPGGIAGWIALHWPVVCRGQLHKLLPAYMLVGWPLALALLGGILLIELCYHRLSMMPNVVPQFRFIWCAVDGTAMLPWLAAVAAVGCGAVLISRRWPHVTAAWTEIPAQGALDR
jgi:branched-chain amino acid transport system permease protein